MEPIAFREFMERNVAGLARKPVRARSAFLCAAHGCPGWVGERLPKPLPAVVSMNKNMNKV